MIVSVVSMIANEFGIGGFRVPSLGRFTGLEEPKGVWSGEGAVHV